MHGLQGSAGVAGLSIQADPGADAAGQLSAAYRTLVAQNPLPDHVKAAVLGAAFGDHHRFRSVLHRAAGDATLVERAGAQNTEEQVLLQLTEMAMGTVPDWPHESIGPWATIAGPNFVAWANLVAFAAQASIIDQCHPESWS